MEEGRGKDERGNGRDGTGQDMGEGKRERRKGGEGLQPPPPPKLQFLAPPLAITSNLAYIQQSSYRTCLYTHAVRDDQANRVFVYKMHNIVFNFTTSLFRKFGRI